MAILKVRTNGSYIDLIDGASLGGQGNTTLQWRQSLMVAMLIEWIVHCCRKFSLC